LIALLSIYLIQTGPSTEDPSLTDATPTSPKSPGAVSGVEDTSTDSAVARLDAEDGEARKAIGRATTPEGLPVAGANVCVGQSRETLSKEVVSSTDTRGELIHSGTYEFVVLVNGSRLVASGNVTVEADKESTIEVVL